MSTISFRVHLLGRLHTHTHTHYLTYCSARQFAQVMRSVEKKKEVVVVQQVMGKTEQRKPPLIQVELYTLQLFEWTAN